MRTSPAAVSFEEFVQARSGSLLRTALLLTGQNRAEAEDLLQLALERAYRHWSRACAADDPERYVRRILANLVLRYFDDLPEAEVAAMLGCSLGTVKSQAARGLARLREAATSAAAPVGSRGREHGSTPDD